MQECIDAWLVLEYKNKQYPSSCSPCFLVAKLCSTGPRLVVDYGKVNKRTQSHSSSLPTMDHNLERISSCRYKTKMNKRSGLRQVDVTTGALKCECSNGSSCHLEWLTSPPYCRKILNKLSYKVRRRAIVQELMEPGAQVKAHIDDVCFGTNTKEDNYILNQQFLSICHQHKQINKPENCEFLR